MSTNLKPSFPHFPLLITLSLLFLAPTNSINMSEEDIKSSINAKTITYGSSLRIQNKMTLFHLSSMGMNWGSGSHLQIITGFKEDNNANSLFTIKEAEGLAPKISGEPVKCGDSIRLEHVTTQKNLHSHEFPSFITGEQEACAFGENGIGDVNDNFIISCYKMEDGETVTGKTEFFLRHNATQKWLHIKYQNSLYHDGNCQGCPIRGQREVALKEKKDKQCLWKVVGGVIFNTDKETKGEKVREKKDEDL